MFDNTTPQPKTRKLGRGAVRTYSFLLNAGGWWSVREMCEWLEIHSTSVIPQVLELMSRNHITRKGAGTAGDPYRYGVVAACVPVPGVELEQPCPQPSNPA